MNQVTHPQPQLVSPPSAHCFFGYYDKCPWNGVQDAILYHRVDFIDRHPEPEDDAEILLHDLGKDEPRVVGTTNAWNFQMGSSLQWIGPDYERFSYNDRDEGTLVARVLDADGNSLRTLDSPLYTASPAGGEALTLNFERLQSVRSGYGYASVDSPGAVEDLPCGDGLFRVDLDSGLRELIVSLERLAAVEPVQSMDDGVHWLNHVTYSPSGDRVAFLHRWKLGDGGIYTRLFTVRPDGSDLRLIADSGKVTHYTWQSDSRIVAWSRSESSISEASKQGLFEYPGLAFVVNIIRRIDVPSWIRQNVFGDQYYVYDVEEVTRDPVGSDVFDSDGHPTFEPNGRWMVTDTYPDSDNERWLFLFDFETGERVDIGSLRSRPTIDSTPFRCDLHPRWNRSGTHVCFDSTHEGYRGVYVCDVSDIMK